MLTTDLVRSSRRGTQLHVAKLTGRTRERARELAELYLGLCRAHEGAPLHELRGACSAVPLKGSEAKLGQGLWKLVEDDCSFEQPQGFEPARLRSEVFLAAAQLRQSDADDFDSKRDALLAQVGEAHGIDANEVEDALYRDLKSEHRMQAASSMTRDQVVERYDLAQKQAVLLRAETVKISLHEFGTADLRNLFRKLKFRRLLFKMTRNEGSVQLEIDGPHSLFGPVTKYGLQLALLLPGLMDAGSFDLEAVVQWGKQRRRLTYRLEHRVRSPPNERASASRLPDEVAGLVKAFESGRSGWQCEPGHAVFEVAGVGLCVPDLLFVHTDGTQVFLEVMGYWSREAVWKRLDLVQAGLAEKVVFAASQRLRVSEELLEDHPSGALYVYKGTMSPRRIVEHLERLRAG